MSRSFHTTRRDIKKQLSYSYSSDEVRADSIRRLKRELYKKRTAKRHVNYERKGSFPEVESKPVELIPIEIDKTSEYLHFPASESDLRDLLARLPAGVVDGLEKISLCLGEYEQTTPESPWFSQPEKDPYLNRIGYELLPGVYLGSCLGIYNAYKREIKIHGYIYSPEMENIEMWELYLRLLMLMTFIHEVGHHYDFTFRIARGRWRGDNNDNAEIYAEYIQHKWLTEYVMPFLQDKYPESVNALEKWIRLNIGISIPWSVIVGDPRSTGKKGMIMMTSFFDTAAAFQCFVGELHQGKDVIEARVEYADDLHLAEKYELALELLDLILEENPEHVRAISLKADIYVHLEEYDKGIYFATQALSLDPEYIEGLRVMVDCYEGMKQWVKVIEISEGILSLLSEKDNWRYDSALFDKANALIELDKINEAERIIMQLENVTQENRIRRRKSMAQRLREKLAKLT